MIREAIFYILECDRCKKERPSSSEYDYTNEKKQAIEDALDDGWIEKDGYHFCPDCQKIWYRDLQDEPVYSPKPWIPVEIWKAKDAFRFLLGRSEYIQLTEDDNNFYLRKYAGREKDLIRYLTDGEREVLMNILGRPFDVTYDADEKSLDWPVGHSVYCVVKIPKTDKEK